MYLHGTNIKHLRQRVNNMRQYQAYRAEHFALFYRYRSSIPAVEACHSFSALTDRYTMFAVTTLVPLIPSNIMVWFPHVLV